MSSSGADRPVRRLQVVRTPVGDAPPARTGGRHRKPDTGELHIDAPEGVTGDSTDTTDIVPVARAQMLSVPPPDGPHRSA